MDFNKGFVVLITRNQDPAFQLGVVASTMSALGLSKEELAAKAKDAFENKTLILDDTYRNAKGYTSPVVSLMGIKRGKGGDAFKVLLDVAIGEVTQAPELQQITGDIDAATGQPIIRFRHSVGTIGINGSSLLGKAVFKKSAMESLVEYERMARSVPRLDESNRFNLNEPVELPNGDKFQTRGLGLTSDAQSAICLVISAPVAGGTDVWRPILACGLYNVGVPDRSAEGTVKAASASDAKANIPGFEDEAYTAPQTEAQTEAQVDSKYTETSNAPTPPESKVDPVEALKAEALSLGADANVLAALSKDPEALGSYVKVLKANANANAKVKRSFAPVNGKF